MKVVPSAVTGVAVHGPDSPAFNDGLAAIPGHTRDLLQPAIPFSVIVENNSIRTITLVGVRFDMAGTGGKHYSVVHYADALRFPQHADFSPGTRRFVCAEPAYTALVVRGEIPVPARTRGRMNLENLGRMLEIRASLDCIAFDDGEFGGPDSQGAFARLARERELEGALLQEVLAMEGEPPGAIEALLAHALADADERARRQLARKLLEALESGGCDQVFTRAKGFERRIALWR
jgi:hypothetical protein